MPPAVSSGYRAGLGLRHRPSSLAPRVFADTAYFVALASKRDALHRQAVQLDRNLPGGMVTTQWILLDVHFEQAGFQRLMKPRRMMVEESASPPYVTGQRGTAILRQHFDAWRAGLHSADDGGVREAFAVKDGEDVICCIGGTGNQEAAARLGVCEEGLLDGG